MGRKLSAGIACKFGKDGAPHGYAVRTAPDSDAHMCEPCADAFDHLVDAQNAWQKQISSLRVPSDASNPKVQGCMECDVALSIIDNDEAMDYSDADRSEVIEAYDHIESHSA